MNEITRSAFSVATNFHEAAIRCLPSVNLPTILPFAMSTNIALACELYLKTNLIALGINPHGHSLKKLYEMLPEQHRKELNAQYSTGPITPDLPLMSALAEVSDAFVEWRYAYEHEKSSLHIGALWRFARVLFAFTDASHRDPYMSDLQRKRLACS